MFGMESKQSYGVPGRSIEVKNDTRNKTECVYKLVHKQIKHGLGLSDLKSAIKFEFIAELLCYAMAS